MKKSRTLLLSSLVLLAACTRMDESIPKRTFEPCKTVASCSSILAEVIASNWNRPKEAKRGMVTVVAITLNEKGEVLTVNVQQSSGLASFDASAVSAVKRSNPFVELMGLPKSDFTSTFTNFTFTFEPMDLRK